jgi:hypothetical protein
MDPSPVFRMAILSEPDFPVNLNGHFTWHRSRFTLAWQPDKLPVAYVGMLLAAILLFELLPFIEEFLRGLRANAGALVPPAARRAASGRADQASPRWAG